MNHLMKYEELKWKDINPFDKDKVSTRKYNNAVPKVNINGVKLEKVKESNKRYNTYTSKLDLNVPIKGYKSATIYTTKEENDEYIRYTLQLTFDKSSLVYKILSGGTNFISYDMSVRIDRIASDQNLCNLIFSNSTEILTKYTVDQITKIITTDIKDILNQDWKKVKESIDEQCAKIDEQSKKSEEIKKKRQTITSRVDEITDLLIDLEDMSKSHKNKINGDTIEFIYEIPGIKVEETEFSEYTSYSRYVSFTNDTAKFVLTKELIDAMNAIEAFKKRLQDETQDSEIKVHLKNNLVMVILTLPRNERDYAGRSGYSPQRYTKR